MATVKVHTLCADVERNETLTFKATNLVVDGGAMIHLHDEASTVSLSIFPNMGGSVRLGRADRPLLADTLYIEQTARKA